MERELLLGFESKFVSVLRRESESGKTFMTHGRLAKILGDCVLLVRNDQQEIIPISSIEYVRLQEGRA